MNKKKSKERKSGNQISESFFREITTAISDMLFTCDRQLNCTYWNLVSEKLTGIPANEAIGRSIHYLFPELRQSMEIEKRCRQAIETGRSQFFDEELCLKGKKYWFRIDVHPMKDGAAVIARDITESVQSERKIRHLNQVLRFIGDVNQLIIKEKNREKLIRKICRLLTKSRDCSSAWIILLDKYNKLALTACSGWGKKIRHNKEIFNILITSKCSRRALKQRGLVVVEDTRKECSGCPLLGINQSCRAFTIRLEHSDQILGLLSVSVPQDFILDRDEQELFEEAANDIGLALHYIEMQEELHQSKASLARAQRIAHLGDWEWDIKGETLTWSDEIYRIFGIDSKFELTYAGIENMVHVADREKNKEFVENLLHTLDSAEIEFRIVRPNGEMRYIYQNAEVCRDEEGKAIRLFGIMQDVTDRKQAEAKFRERMKTLDDIVKTIPSGLFIYQFKSPNKLILTYCNPEAERLTGIKLSIWRGKEFNKIWPAAKKLGLTKSFMEIMISGKTYEAEHLYYKDNRLDGIFRIRAFPLPNNRLAVAFENVTEQNHTEKMLRKSQRELRNLAAHLQSAIEQERAMIAREIHDELSQQITALRMDLGWLGNNLPKRNRALMEKKKTMVKQVEEIMHTIKQISSELRPGFLDELGLVGAIELYAEEFEENSGIPCKLSVCIEDLNMDRERSVALFRIFQEALTNVKRHSQATEVRCKLKEEDGKVVLTIRDNGRGISEDQLKALDSYGIIGMRERVDYFLGKISIRGNVNKGTTIIVKIPFNQSGDEA